MKTTKKQPIILHRSLGSPYARKIQTMLAHTGQEYLSVIASKGVPRPIQEKLVGGYSRRIPILQIGSDIYCDTKLISSEIAKQTNRPELDPLQQSVDDKMLMEKIDTQHFVEMVMTMSAWEFIRCSFSLMPPQHACKLITDRAKLAKKIKDKKPDVATKIKYNHSLKSFFSEIENQLGKRPFLGKNESPTALDFTAYTTLWYGHKLNGLKQASKTKNITDWLYRMDAYGTGKTTEIGGNTALDIAKNTKPRPIPENMKSSPKVGKPFSFKPTDGLS
ncbi:glutathione S-transferase [Fulvitalea axinellae]|uniref:Glutathione S-transferase n=1 Tax=Fulvitalea axinellae TaxID=1182444 RepID=A0AAU9CGF6_9BACT|nr:glutathione S-transferase [Fulvitalea axinellae]